MIKSLESALRLPRHSPVVMTSSNNKFHSAEQGNRTGLRRVITERRANEENYVLLINLFALFLLDTLKKEASSAV